MKEGFWYKISLRVVPFVFVWVTRIWFGTCRVKTHGQEYRSQVDKCGGPVVASFWHYTILFIFYYMRRETGVAMVSASRDGEYISRIAKKFGYETVRGSRGKGGMQAMKGLIRAMRAGRNAAIVADGSQGPARVVRWFLRRIMERLCCLCSGPATGTSVSAPGMERCCPCRFPG